MLFEEILTKLNQSQYTQAQKPENREYGLEYSFYLDDNKYVEINTINNQHTIKLTDLIILTPNILIFGANDIYPLNIIKEINILSKETDSEGDSTNKNKYMDFTIIEQITKKIDIETNFEYIPESIDTIETVPSVQGMIRTTDKNNTIYFDIFYRLNGVNAPYRVYWEHTLIIQTDKPETLTVDKLLHDYEVGVMVDAYIIQNIDGLIGGGAPLYTDVVQEIYGEKKVENN